MTNAAQTGAALVSGARKTRQDQRDPEAMPVPVIGGDNRKVRQTVDLSYGRHRDLAKWRAETMVELGRTKLSNQEVLAAVIGVLLTDEVVSRRVKAYIADPDRT